MAIFCYPVSREYTYVFIFVPKKENPLYTPRVQSVQGIKKKPANVVFTGFSYGAGSRTRTGDRELFLKRQNRTLVRCSFLSVYHTLLGLSSSFGSLSADLRAQIFPFGVFVSHSSFFTTISPDLVA